MDAETELLDLYREMRAFYFVLSELAKWGENHLDNDAADRQHIAEHLTASLAALAKGDSLPRSPF